MTKIKDLPKVDRPREKLEKYGLQKLSDVELLALLLGSGVEGKNVLSLSKEILGQIKKIGTVNMKKENLEKIHGLGKAKISQILATIELGKRLNDTESVSVLSPEDVWKLCGDIRESKKEHLVAFYLDIQNRLIERQIISIGILNASLVHPREIFEPAVRLSAASVVIAHNHPSGNLEPSEEDLKMTKKLIGSGNMLGIEVADHIIVTKGKFLSFKEQKLI